MILSVSRRTDIPNYYSDWFINRLKEGFLYVRNPVNQHQISRINLSPDVVDCIVFWTKNPTNMIEKLEYLQDYLYYFQFTLNGYGKDIEPDIPDIGERISTFQKLAKMTGKERVVWRYDPILINGRYTADYHIKMFEETAKKLSGYTEKVIISFVDFYTKIKRNMNELSVKKISDEEIKNLAEQMAGIALKYEITIQTCAEQTELEDAGIRHGSCIDKELIEKISGCRMTLKKDKNQREACGCYESVEVGTYHTCLNGCKYCYANFSDEKVRKNAGLYDVYSPLLCGNVGPDDKITDRKVKSLMQK